MAEPRKNEAYDFPLTLIDSVTGGLRTNPTIAVGDFKVSTDGAAFVDLATIPVVTPAGSTSVKINLSADEMNGDKIVVQGIDVAGAEWDGVFVFIEVPEGTVETLLDIEEGDRVETSTSFVINKKGTSTPILSKDISGSLLSPSVTITTTEAP